MVLKRIVKKKTNESIKRELLNSLQENDNVKEQGLNERANNVNNSQEAILVIHRYEDIIKTQNEKRMSYIGKQGQLLQKIKDTENFFYNVGQSKSMIYFKISLYKFLKKYPLLKKSTLQSSCSKNNFKGIKNVWKETPTFFV